MNDEQISIILMFSCMGAIAARGGTWPIEGELCTVFWFVASVVFWVSMVVLMKWFEKALDWYYKHGN